MKRIFALTTAILLILGLTAFGSAKADVTPENSRLMNNAYEAFSASGFTYIETTEEIPPFHRLQKMINITFNSIGENYRQYTIDYEDGSSYGPSVHILDLFLYYDRALLTDGQPFINGTFIYHWERNGEIVDYTGTVQGNLVEISTENMGFVADYEYTNALALDLIVDNGSWDWIIYLEIPGEEEYYMTYMFTEDEYHDHESSPHIPSPSTQAEVAAGVGISTVGIAVANGLTKTSMLGSASFNVPAAQAGQAARTASDAASNTRSYVNSGVLNSIKNFFKNLFANLRDMLTDEGRSFASGRISDFLEDAEIDNTGDDN